MLFDVAIISPVLPGQEILGDLVGTDSGMLLLAFWTIVIEVPLFFLCGYREKKQLLYFAGVNLVSNLMLNGFLETVGDDYNLAMAIGEVAVVLLEFCLCCYFIKGDRKKLFRTLVFTNAVSFLAGLAFLFLFDLL